ncbi:hypothetical protein [Shimazuella alba]|uniref:Uncharacterized protein n=1 Tax=Shimazuella alba TaxID=2690964 RepID=A0A6I4W479_9BACL|nr:hypothetical protein [Shimazuella alba]MXQ55584.1 hypothetical protein [Shimazuella alba]
MTATNAETLLYLCREKSTSFEESAYDIVIKLLRREKDRHFFTSRVGSRPYSRTHHNQCKTEEELSAIMRLSDWSTRLTEMEMWVILYPCITV